MKRLLIYSLRVLLLSLVGLVCSSSLAGQIGSNFLEFDGTSVIGLPGFDAPAAREEEVTLSLWVAPGLLLPTEPQVLIEQGESNFEWRVILVGDADSGASAGGRLIVELADGSLPIAAPALLTPENWHQLAIVYRDGALTIFVDGVETASKKEVALFLLSDRPFYLGGSRTGRYPGFRGGLDEIRIWTRALGPGEIEAGMTSELSGLEPGLRGYFPISAGGGQSIDNGGFADLDGWLGATPIEDSRDPRWVSIGTSTNRPPQVEVVGDHHLALPNATATLEGRVADDGLPRDSIALRWQVLAGPDEVVFENPSVARTKAHFMTPGVYDLRLEAADGELTSSGDLRVVIDPSTRLQRIVVVPNPATLKPGQSREFRAHGLDQTGKPFALDPVWSATKGQLDEGGQYLAPPEEARGLIVARADGVVGTAEVTVVEESLPWPTNGWPTALPIEAGMDQTLLEQARDYALTGSGSGYITRFGKLVMSWGSTTTKYPLKSSTKSMGSLIVGTALKDGLISLDDLAQTHFPEFGVPPTTNGDTGWLDQITLLHLGTMSAGFDKPGGYIDLLFEPGTTWAYSDGGANWLADVMTTLYQDDLRDVLDERILAPLNIPQGDLTWRLHDYRDESLNGITRREFGSGINTTVDAMARIGYLFLRDGMWESNEILPQVFVDQVRTTVPAVVGLPVDNDVTNRYLDSPKHYGILWWNNADSYMPDVPTDAYWSWGLRDSLILVIPSLDIVASRAGSSWDGERSPSFYQVLEPFITAIAQAVIPGSNTAPQVDVGPDLVIDLPPGTGDLDGLASDDGLPDPPGQLTVSWTQVSGPGTVAFTDSGAAQTSASFPEVGDYVLRLTADDGELSDSDTLAVTVASANAPPTASPDLVATDEDTPVRIDVASNDTDTDGNLDPGSVNSSCAQCTGVENGDLTNNGNGTFDYSPWQDFFGEDGFTYEICDSEALCATADVTITVIAVNDPPVAGADEVTVAEDAISSFNVLDNDTDVDDNLDSTTVNTACVECSQPAHGDLTHLGQGLFEFSPDQDYWGLDGFTYEVCDSEGACVTAGVSITVSSVNDPPLPADDELTTAEDTPGVLGVLGNDTDVDGNLDPTTTNTSCAACGGPVHGVLVNYNNGSFEYSPEPDFAGSDGFVYEICDTDAACATASVAITVTPVNDPPQAADDEVSTSEDLPVTFGVLANDSDVDGNLDPGSVKTTCDVCTEPTNGTLVNHGDGNFEYAPEPDFFGLDGLDYEVCDTAGECSSARVSITVAAVNDPPLAQPDFAAVLIANTATLDVAANDEDVDGDIDPSSANTSCGLCSEPRGTLVNNGDGTFDYTPPAGIIVGDSFDYQICDMEGACSTALVTIQILLTNSPPVARDDRFETAEDQSRVLSVIDNDSDPDGNLDTASANTDCLDCSGPAGGTLFNNGDGSFEFTPDPDFYGTQSMVYEICDTLSACATATAQIIVLAVNDPPTAMDDEVSTPTGKAVTIAVAENDSDPDGDLDLLSTNNHCLVCTEPGSGSLFNNGDGTFEYHPNLGFDGIDDFVYEICDRELECANASVTITVGFGGNPEIFLDGFESGDTSEWDPPEEP